MGASYIDRRPDGSLALFLDGDLQFDSRDERIYHECLTLPALALAERRMARGLSILIVGGGDGFVAREVLKSPAVRQVTLVDYDPAVVALARTEWPHLLDGALDDPRLAIRHEDAWDFVEGAIARKESFDLAIADLTVPQDVAGTRFASVDWLQRLSALLSRRGVAALNVASPSQSPEAYWSVYNAARLVGLHPRPYRIHLPSFAAAQYGPDWGFLLGSADPIAPAELGDDLPLATPREVLRDSEQLRRLFWFPGEVAALRETASPIRAGQGRFLTYLQTPYQPADPEPTWDGLAFVLDPSPCPAVDQGDRLLPEPLREALADPAPPDERQLLERVLALMPSLRRFGPAPMVAEILWDPARFLSGLDWRGLIERLLARASELPARFVAELTHARERIGDWVLDREAFLKLGLRVMSVITVVVILASLSHPDSAYSKGAGLHFHAAASLARPAHALTDVAPPSLARQGGFHDVQVGHRLVVDEFGYTYPARSYHFTNWMPLSGGAPSGAVPGLAYYRLTPDIDILGDGLVALNLGQRAYLLFGNGQVDLVDQASGQSVLTLEPQPLLLWRVAQELDRQRTGLEQTRVAKRAWIQWVSWLDFTPWARDDEATMQNLAASIDRLRIARNSLGLVPTERPDPPDSPVTGAVELFNAAWVLPGGHQLLVKESAGDFVYLTPTGWSHDQDGRHPITRPYPNALRPIVADYLHGLVSDAEATQQAYLRDRVDLTQDLASLRSDEAAYNQTAARSAGDPMVDYGSSEIRLSRAQLLTAHDLDLTLASLAQLNQILGQWPQDQATLGEAYEAWRP
jgi:spermidine synthase